MAVAMAAQFSEDGKYFAKLTADGKLKIWNTLTNSFEQEYTPDFHLTTPCTCLHFINLNTSRIKGVSPKKKKRRLSETSSEPSIALGTTNGLLLLYSLSKANVDFTIDSATSQTINCLSSADSCILYSGAGQNVLVWNIESRKFLSKWKVGNETVSAILAVPDTNKIFTAAKSIKLWDVQTKQVLRTFTGHSSEVTCLKYILPSDTSSTYIISGSKGDRLLNCWSLSESANDRNAIASFLMEDVVESVEVNLSSEGVTKMVTTLRSGMVHLFQHTLNGKCSKPLKPKTSIQVVSDTGQSKDTITPIRILGASFVDSETLCIGYGSEAILHFENITISINKKLQCLVRKDQQSKTLKQDQSSKTVTPSVSNAHYLTSQTSTVGADSASTKRKIDGKAEIPMEKRLENLTLKVDGDKAPKAGHNMAHLLVQGLHSKDRNILRTVLSKRDEELIVNTVKRLPVNVLVPLIQELSKFVSGKTLSAQIGRVWMKQIIQTHASVLISNADLPNLLGSTVGSIESRLSLATSVNRLRGRIDLLIPQVSGTQGQQNGDDEQAVLVYDDRDESDHSDIDLEIEENSESENEWEEESIDGETPGNNAEASESDAEMST
ncbi:unnamed protein product [Acanthoscelides obtectus]|uniref:Small-subunit processome Utp12 domain-containing protein n=1 Tax=Acanthoscelides obtectus TaxID=200917 RepID=A0A9P0PPP6_ACAOB|nr:unnamed protein product [Acanthoscelides obtectus]CAK1664930.1 WD repeat-containing protein 43 [Acanthoscelides obtectus]